MKTLILALVLISTQAMASIVLNVRCEDKTNSYNNLNMQLMMGSKPTVDYFYKGNLQSSNAVLSQVEQSRSSFKGKLLVNFGQALASHVSLELDLKKCNNVALAGKADLTNYSYSLVNLVKSPLACKCVYAQN